MVQTLVMMPLRVTQCCTVDWFPNPITARTVVASPISKMIAIAQTGIRNIVSYGKFSKSTNDSFLVNLPPADAVSNMNPLAAKPADD